MPQIVVDIHGQLWPNVAMQIMTPKEAAQYLRRSKRTLRRWDLAGTLKPAGRYPNGRPYYTRQQLDRFAGIKGEDDGEDRKDP